MKKICGQCGAEFDKEEIPGMEGFFKNLPCPECMNENAEARRAECEKRDQQIRVSNWISFCPPAFRETEIQKLPRSGPSHAVLKWEFNRRGLVLFGPTRCGKTRTAWLLLQKQFMQDRKIIVMDSMSGFEYGAVFSNGSPLDWVNDRSCCELLFMDDVFKVKLTDSFEAALFAIIDKRMNFRRPIIATLNDTGETLAARMTDDRGNAFIARLKEMCDTVVF